ncbi:MAG: DsbA family protein, partial [Bacteroidota bacterium]
MGSLNMAIDITVYSDYICPYCYVGMGTLHKLQEKYDLNITWKGMEIHPDTPEEGMLLTDFFKDADVPSMLAGLKARAEEVGLPFGDL